MIILCSASPRRKEILENLGLKFDICPAQIDENEIPNEKPLEYLKRVSSAKAWEVSKSWASSQSLENNKNQLENKTNNLFIASDTIVVFEGRILHKPENTKQAEEILSLLSGKQHTVYSGLALLQSGNLLWDYDETLIQFKSWDLQEIRNYIEIAKPFDKAGAYGIQDSNSPVENYKGSYSNVMGFPIRKFLKYRDLWIRQ
ncbi:MAG: septum formation protein Maf [Leptospira sp.]|nr:septum formation protein Maf [Leptospira sp.]